MKKSLLVLAMAAVFAPALAQAEAGDIVVRLRATHVAPDESSKLGAQTDATYGTGTANLVYGAGGTGAHLVVGNNTIPEIDFSYYVTKNIAAELILALGTRHKVSVGGMGAGAAITSPYLGKVNLLPPTLTAQWHFMPDQTFDPYVGAGVAYVLGMDRGLTAQVAGGRAIKIDRSMFGGVIQAGFDVNLQDKWLVNFDVKKAWVDTKVSLDTQGLAGTATGFQKIDNLNINPWILSVGIGKKF